MKNAKYQYNNIPVLDMVAVQRAPFTSTKGSENNLFEPNMRVRDSQVLTRDVPIFIQMWLKLRSNMTAFYF